MLFLFLLVSLAAKMLLLDRKGLYHVVLEMGSKANYYFGKYGSRMINIVSYFGKMNVCLRT